MKISSQSRLNALNIIIPILIPAVTTFAVDMTVYDYTNVGEFLLLSTAPLSVFVFYIPSEKLMVALLIAMRITTVLPFLSWRPESDAVVTKTIVNIILTISFAVIGFIFMILGRQ